MTYEKFLNKINSSFDRIIDSKIGDRISQSTPLFAGVVLALTILITLWSILGPLFKS